MFALKKISGNQVNKDMFLSSLTSWTIFFQVLSASARKKEPDGCIFCSIKSSFACCYERLNKNSHKKIELVYCQEELLDDLLILFLEKEHLSIAKILNERHVHLKEKQSINEQEYISLNQA